MKDHTPTPWKYEVKQYGSSDGYISRAEFLRDSKSGTKPVFVHDENNAAFIVQAVNAYETFWRFIANASRNETSLYELVDEAQKIIREHEQSIAKAEGQ